FQRFNGFVLLVLAPAFIGTTVFFHQDYLTQVNDWPPGSYALSLSVLALSTVVFALICGALIDRLSARSVISIFLPPLAASCFVLGRGGPAEMLFGAMALLGMSYGFSSTLFGAIWPVDLWHATSRGDQVVGPVDDGFRHGCGAGRHGNADRCWCAVSFTAGLARTLLSGRGRHDGVRVMAPASAQTRPRRRSEAADWIGPPWS
ncbi:MAG: hypothetical protein U5Q16_15650, partial [Gammaproteobacteria bacterium]|nr:hypothetical protein [Gammaproteobacteria bacterium]